MEENANFADPAQVKDQARKAKRLKEDQLNELRAVLKTREGRKLLWRYLGICGVYEQSFNGNGSWTFFNEGRRSVGLMILAEITKASPEAFLEMMKEEKGE